MFRYITGTMRVRIKTKTQESVINRLRKHIPITDIKKVDTDTLEFTTVYTGRKEVYDTAQLFGESVEILHASGIPVLFDRYKKRLGMWIGLVFSIIAVFVSSNMIWEMRISGNTYVSDDDIIRNLKSLGVAEGRFINKEMLDEVYNSFLIKEPRISWISVNFDGTVAKVEVKETKITPERLDRDKNINIVAKCDGIIKRVDVFDGKSEVKPGEPVTKGQLLVSSFVETRKTGMFMKAARSNVWASTVHNYDICINKEYFEKEVAGQRKKVSVVILGKRLPLYVPDKKAVLNVESEYSKSRFLLFGRFSLPFVTEIKKETSYNGKYVSISEEEAKQKAENELAKRIDTELKEAEIIERSQSVTETENEYVFHYELICLENIAESMEFMFE